MKLKKIVDRIIRLDLAKNNDIAIIGDGKDPNAYPGLKYFTYDDIPLIKENSFKFIILRDPSKIKNGQLNDIFKLSRKYVLLEDPSYMGALKKTNDFVKETLDGGFGQIYDPKKRNSDANVISEEIEKSDIDKNFTIFSKDGDIFSNLESLSDKNTSEDDDFLINFALIQNLKKQISEKEKEIVSKSKDIEILKKGMESSNEISRNKINNLKIILEQRSREKKILSKSFREKEIEMDKMRGDFQRTIEERSRKLEQDYKRKVKEIEEQKLKYHEDINSELDRLERMYTQKNERLKKTIKKLETKLRKEKRRLIVNHSKELESYKERISALKDQYQKEITGISDAYEKQIRKLHEKESELRESFKKEKKLISKNYENKISIKGEQIKNLKNEINERLSDIGLLEDKILELKKQHQSEMMKISQKIEKINEEHEREKEEIIIKLGREIKKRDDELNEVKSKYKRDVQEKISKTIDIKQRKEREISKLKSELNSIKSSPIYRLLSKLDFFNEKDDEPDIEWV